MIFTNELIPEAEKTRFDWTEFKAWPLGYAHRPWKWTVNREHDAFLIPVEQIGYDDTLTRPDQFIFWWRGKLIRIEAKLSGSGSGKFWDVHLWRISRVDIPAELRDSKSEVFSALRDAIAAHGRFFDASHAKSVCVEFLNGGA